MFSDKFKSREFLWFSVFPAMSFWYFITQFFGLDYHTIHLASDDLIPFIPIFVFPYIIWYAYVPLMMLYIYLNDRDSFRRQALTLCAGALFCAVFFVACPTSVDLRPDVIGNGISERLCRIIFASDKPVNVLPSLHCYEAVVIHMTSFTSQKMRSKKAFRLCSAVIAALICLSTVFIKQHSIADVIAGCLLAVILFVAVPLFAKRKIENDSKTV